MFPGESIGQGPPFADEHACISMPIPTPPKFEKKIHHVVPASWQRLFAAPGAPGPCYLNIVTGQRLPAQGPGDKMAEPYANIVFDAFFRPSDKLEDDLGAKESKAIPELVRACSQGVLDRSARASIAYLLALQATRYPELYPSRLDHGKYLAVALSDLRSLPDFPAVNANLQKAFPGAAITRQEFEDLKGLPAAEMQRQVEGILHLHGYEEEFNPELVMAATLTIAGHLLAFEWQLVESPTMDFVLSDRPVPNRILHGYGVALSARYGLLIKYPTQPVDEQPIPARPATPQEVRQINSEVRARAREWVCGAGPGVYTV